MSDADLIPYHEPADSNHILWWKNDTTTDVSRSNLLFPCLSFHQRVMHVHSFIANITEFFHYVSYSMTSIEELRNAERKEQLFSLSRYFKMTVTGLFNINGL
jgi:hypothetical protein